MPAVPESATWPPSVESWSDRRPRRLAATVVLSSLQEHTVNENFSTAMMLIGFALSAVLSTRLMINHTVDLGGLGLDPRQARVAPPCPGVAAEPTLGHSCAARPRRRGTRRSAGPPAVAMRGRLVDVGTVPTPPGLS